MSAAGTLRRGEALVLSQSRSVLTGGESQHLQPPFPSPLSPLPPLPPPPRRRRRYSPAAIGGVRSSNISQLVKSDDEETGEAGGCRPTRPRLLLPWGHANERDDSVCQLLQVHHFSFLQREGEKLLVDIDKMRSEQQRENEKIRYEIDNFSHGLKAEGHELKVQLEANKK